MERDKEADMFFVGRDKEIDRDFTERYRMFRDT